FGRVLLHALAAIHLEHIRARGLPHDLAHERVDVHERGVARKELHPRGVEPEICLDDDPVVDPKVMAIGIEEVHPPGLLEPGADHRKHHAAFTMSSGSGALTGGTRGAFRVLPSFSTPPGRTRSN